MYTLQNMPESHLALFSTLGRNAFAQLNSDWQIAPIPRHNARCWRAVKTKLTQTNCCIFVTDIKQLSAVYYELGLRYDKTRKNSFFAHECPICRNNNVADLTGHNRNIHDKVQKQQKKFCGYLIFELKNCSTIKSLPSSLSPHSVQS